MGINDDMNGKANKNKGQGLKALISGRGMNKNKLPEDEKALGFKTWLGLYLNVLSQGMLEIWRKSGGVRYVSEGFDEGGNLVETVWDFHYDFARGMCFDELLVLIDTEVLNMGGVGMSYMDGTGAEMQKIKELKDLVKRLKQEI